MKNITLLLLITLVSMVRLVAQTYIADKQEVYGTWTKANSPYIIKGEAIVPLNHTLTIEPGVVVKFKTGGNRYYTAANFDVGMLRVLGTLVANGTAAEFITFTSLGEGRWGVVIIEDQKNAFLLSYCLFEKGDMVYDSRVGKEGDYTSHGVLAIHNSKGHIHHCIFHKNYSWVLFTDNAKLQIESCTFIDNQFEDMYNEVSNIILKNSILGKNSIGAKANNITGGTTHIEYSLVQNGLYPGTLSNNIIYDKDPLFRNPSKGDFRLQPNSPCIGAGENGVDLGAIPYKAPSASDITAPEIVLYEPSVSRDMRIAAPTKQILVRGKATDKSGIFEVSINGVEANVDNTGNFSQSINLSVGENAITIKAVDTKNNTGSYTFYIDRQTTTYTPPPPPTKAEKRLALVIGNAHYIQTGQNLKNPINDASLMISTLKSMGFEVIFRLDADKTTMEKAIWEYSKKLPNYNVALFYYAGHGVQIDGQNYLIPTDAILAEKGDCRHEAVAVSFVVEEFEKYPNNTNVVILDACRSNPFRSWARGDAQGFKSISPTSGTIISFATSEGATASDGTGENGLFTQELVKQMKVPQSIESVFKRTRVEVERISNNTQSPQEWTKLKGDFWFNYE